MSFPQWNDRDIGWRRQHKGLLNWCYLITVIRKRWPRCKAVTKVIQPFSLPPSGALSVPSEHFWGSRARWERGSHGLRPVSLGLGQRIVRVHTVCTWKIGQVGDESKRGAAKAAGRSGSCTLAAQHSPAESSPSLFSTSAASCITHACTAPSFTDAMRRNQIR